MPLAGASLDRRCTAEHGWALAYALAWLSVSGGNSVMPPWVRHQFPEAGQLVRRLRDEACADPRLLMVPGPPQRLPGVEALLRVRQLQAGTRRRRRRAPYQQLIVETAMQGRNVLAILPTGAGKSLCYQIPALSRYDKTGALTVVISPLVALMADQVAGLREARDHLVRHDQRAPVDARAGPRRWRGCGWATPPSC